jgi:hypothetical protein
MTAKQNSRLQNILSMTGVKRTMLLPKIPVSINLLIKLLGDFRYLIFSLPIKSKKKFKDKYDECHCTTLVVGKMFQRLLDFH